MPKTKKKLKQHRAALYARVSTTDQAQIDPLHDYAEARGFEIAGEFIDHGVSGEPP